MYWSIEAKSVIKNIKLRYQKFIFTRGVAKFIISSSKPNAKAFVKTGANNITVRLKISIKPVNLSKISTLKRSFLFVDTKFGKKACVKAPSAKSLLKRFGSLKATKKISLHMLAPRMDAVSISLINPKILETKIPKLFVKKFFSMIYSKMTAAIAKPPSWLMLRLEFFILKFDFIF